MNLDKRFSFENFFLYLRKENTIVFGDVHMGYEEALNKQGILIPRTQYSLTAKRLEEFFEGKKFDKIVINGDLKHEFGSISETEWRHTLRIIDYLALKCKKLILVKGNHDKILGPIAEKRNIEIVDYLIMDDIFICHGHYIPDAIFSKKIKSVIVGHEHPAISLMDYPRIEKFKCFLNGKWKGKELIVHPSFNLMTEGTDILKEKLLSPFIEKVDSFRVFILGREILDFGIVKDLKLAKQNFYF